MLKHIILSAAVLIGAGIAVADDNDRAAGIHRFDLDGNGEITRAEFEQAFERWMQTKVEWLDVNGDGVVTPEEFHVRHKAEYDQRWARWDADGDGVASVAEIQKLRHTQPEALREYMAH